MNKIEIYKRLLEDIYSSMKEPEDDITISKLIRLRRTFALAEKVSIKLIDAWEKGKEYNPNELADFLLTIYDNIELISKILEAKRVLNEN